MRYPGAKPLLGALCLGAWVLAAGCTTAPTAKPTAAALPPTGAGAPPPTVKAELERANQLVTTRHLTEAQVIYEQCIAREPNNAAARFRLAVDLVFAAQDNSDPAAALRKQAREQLFEARRLGSEEPLVATLLAALPADGSPPADARFSPNGQVEKLMRDAEAAFGAGEYLKAAQLHQQAFALEPRNYLAALYCGHAYAARKDFASAGEWFAKAIAIEPDRETAHRYWASVLMQQRRFQEATAQYIDAVVAEPYNQITRGRFQQYCQRVGLSSRIEGMSLPAAAAKVVDGKIEIYLPPDSDAYAGALGSLYAAACGDFRTKEFARQYPEEKRMRRSLPEEVAGLRAVLEFVREAAVATDGGPTDAESARWKPGLDQLGEIEKAGLLEAFALLDRADDDLARDYPAYRAAHRDELRRYLRRYWCGLD